MEAQKNEAAPTRFKNDYDCAYDIGAVIIIPAQAELNQKAQKWKENEATPTWFKNDYDRAYEAAQAELNQKGGLYHGARTTVTRFWEKGSPEDLIVQDADKAIARPLRGIERLHFKIGPLDKGLYYVTRDGELIDKVTKEKAEEAHNIRTQKVRIQKEAEGCCKMLAATGTIE